MATVLRLARGGAKKSPFYRIVAADRRAPRDGNYIEKLGTFNPMVAKDNPMRLVVNEERAKYWLGVGAIPSDRVTRLLAELGVVKAKDFSGKPQKTRKKADKMTRKEKAAQALEEAKEAEATAPAKAEAAPAETEAEAKTETATKDGEAA
jgi:small subunit ribosomal protein S16